MIGVRYTQSNIQNADHILSPPASPAFSVENASPSPSQSSTPTLKSPTLQSGTPFTSMRQQPNPPKRRRNQQDTVQTILEKAIEADLKKNSEQPVPDDPDELFCKSLVASFKGLSKRKNKQAKIKVMQIFLELESDEE